MQQKQQLLRAREAAIWEMEERQLHEKYQVAKSQLKDHFFLQRHQMLTRHDKELEQVLCLVSGKLLGKRDFGAYLLWGFIKNSPPWREVNINNAFQEKNYA